MISTAASQDHAPTRRKIAPQTAWSHISTVAKHGANILNVLRDAITGSPWTPPVTC